MILDESEFTVEKLLWEFSDLPQTQLAVTSVLIFIAQSS